MVETFTGEIGLNRERHDLSAGFCLLKASLGSLVEKTQLLHPSENAYYQTLKHESRRASYLGGRIAAKMAIGALAGGGDAASIAIEFGVFQFPVVRHYPGGGVQVSISHCDDLGVALAFPEAHPLGIDLERADRANTEAIKSYITPGESALLARHRLDETPGFTLLWTMKESVSKILRTGLMIDLSLLEIDLLEIVPETAGARVGDAADRAEAATYTATFRHLGQYKAMSRFHKKYVCSVALPRQTTPQLDAFWDAYRNVTG